MQTQANRYLATGRSLQLLRVDIDFETSIIRNFSNSYELIYISIVSILTLVYIYIKNNYSTDFGCVVLDGGGAGAACAQRR